MVTCVYDTTDKTRQPETYCQTVMLQANLSLYEHGAMFISGLRNKAPNMKKKYEESF